MYDATGNRLETTENGVTTKYQPNAANQYAQIAHGTEIVEPEYGPQGNLLHDATRHYTWDADIHLLSVTTQGARAPSPAAGDAAVSRPATPGGAARLTPFNALDEAPTADTTTRFQYDPLHRRVARVKDSGEITVFVYDGWNVITELTAKVPLAERNDPGAKTSGTTGSAAQGGARLTPPVSAALRLQLAANLKLETANLKLIRHTWGEDLSGSLQGAGGIGGLLSTRFPSGISDLPSSGQSAFHHYDSNGNVILLTDAQANESARYAYDAFGRTRTATGPAAKTNRYRFSTKPVEEESGLCYYGYRYYDPITGRWPSRDPIRESGGINIYAALNNDLLTRMDFLGMNEQEPTCEKASDIGNTRSVCQVTWSQHVHPVVDAVAKEVVNKVGNRYGVPGSITVNIFEATNAGIQQMVSTMGASLGFYYRKVDEKCVRKGSSLPLCGWYSWEPDGTLPTWAYHDTYLLNQALNQGEAYIQPIREAWEDRVKNYQ